MNLYTKEQSPWKNVCMYRKQMCPLMILALEEEIQEKNFEFNLTLRYKGGSGGSDWGDAQGHHHSGIHVFGARAEAEGRETLS